MVKEPYDNEIMLFLCYHNGHVGGVGVVRYKETGMFRKHLVTHRS